MVESAGPLEDSGDLLGPDAFRDQRHHDVFRAWRRADPVHWHVDSAGTGFWCLTKQADVQMVSRDPETFVSGRGFTLVDIDPEDSQGKMMMQMLPGMDRPEHTRYRRIVSKGFSPRTLRLVEDHLALKARRIVDRVVGRGSCDFVEDVAAELPLQAIAELMGVPERRPAQDLPMGQHDDRHRRPRVRWGQGRGHGGFGRDARLCRRAPPAALHRST